MVATVGFNCLSPNSCGVVLCYVLHFTVAHYVLRIYEPAFTKETVNVVSVSQFLACLKKKLTWTVLGHNLWNVIVEWKEH